MSWLTQALAAVKRRSLRSQVDTLTLSVAALAAQVKSWPALFGGLGDRIAGNTEQISTLTTRLTALEDKTVSQLDSIITELQQENSALSVLPSLLTEAQSAAQLAGQAHDDLAALKTQVASLQQQIAAGGAPDLSGLQAQADAIQQSLAPLGNLKPQLDSVVNALATPPPPAPGDTGTPPPSADGSSPPASTGA